MASGVRYSDEFRSEAVQLVLAGRSYNEVADLLGCSSYSIREWVRKYQVSLGGGQDVPSPVERAEIRELKRELLLVRQERDLLKKACAVFAQDVRNLPM